MFRHRWLRRVVLGLGGLILLAAAGTLYFRHAGRQAGVSRHAAVVAHLDATDPRWRLDEIDADRGTLPDDQNSARLVPQVTAALAGPSGPVSDRADRTGLYSQVPPNHHLDPDGEAALDRALDGNARALAIARQFRDHPRGLRRYAITTDVIGTLVPDLHETRNVMSLLDLEAERLSADGRPGAALQLVPIQLNVARSIDREPFLISCLVRISLDTIIVRRVERTLALGEPAGRLAEVQAALLQEAEQHLFWEALRGERAGMDRLFTNLRNGTLPPSLVLAMMGDTPLSQTGLKEQAVGWAYAHYLPNDHAVYLETVTRVIEARALPEHQQRAAVTAVPLPPQELGAMLTHLLLPATMKCHDSALRIRAQLRCAATALAVERFRQAHGRWPQALTEIPRHLLPAVPLDPFDGQPLRYVKRPDGVTVYSIGLDDQDDHGNIPDGGTSPAEKGTDLGCRLYDVARRGLPPAPRTKSGSIAGAETAHPVPWPRELVDKPPTRNR